MESGEGCFEAMDSPLQLPALTDDAIVEILSRLPVKSLLKFKSVCKSWHSLISSDYFIKTHRQNSTINPNFSRHKIISTINRPFWRLKQYSFPCLTCDQDICSFHFDCTIEFPKAFNVVGSCNGLICVIIDKNIFYLWNPATTEFKRLPNFLEGSSKFIEQSYSSKYGFGFDESSDDYKVFAIMSVIKKPGKKSNTNHQATLAKVYSLKADSWKRIDFFEDDSPLDAGGKFASGKLHWNRDSGLNTRWHIASFDLKTEAFGTVEQPSYVEGGFYPALGLFDGHLCVLCDYCKTQLDVWIWSQYGVRDSWSKMVTISYPLERALSNPLCILPNREVLFTDDESSFVSCSPEKGWICYPDQIIDGVELLGYESVEYLGAEVFVESLVSLADDDMSKNHGSKKGKNDDMSKSHGNRKKWKIHKSYRRNC